MEVFGFDLEEFIPGVEIAGAAGFLDFASDADIQLFV
jgi:predicted peroxiredoxin